MMQQALRRSARNQLSSTSANYLESLVSSASNQTGQVLRSAFENAKSASPFVNTNEQDKLTKANSDSDSVLSPNKQERSGDEFGNNKEKSQRTKQTQHQTKKVKLDSSDKTTIPNTTDTQTTTTTTAATTTPIATPTTGATSATSVVYTVFKKGNKNIVLSPDQSSSSGSNSAKTMEKVADLYPVVSHIDRLVGLHASTEGGVENAPINAALAGANAFALDTRSKRKWVSAPYTQTNINSFKERCNALGYKPHQILPHGSYLINVGSPDKETLKKSQDALVEEVKRCEQLGLTQYNFHPGSTTGKCTVEESIKSIAAAIDAAIEATTGVTVVIESMAGQGFSLGGKFEEIRDIIKLVKNKHRVGVCLDTCHLFAAGFDLRTKDTYEKVMQDFDKIIGFSYLRGMHLNDSKGDLGCKKDRHENIGKGKLGLGSFKLIMNDERLKHVPMILETPPVSDNDDSKSLAGYNKEIDLLRSLVETKKPNL